MNPVDTSIVTFLNRFAGHSSTFDQFVWLAANNYVLKTGVIMALLHGTWFRRNERHDDHRATMIFGLFASCAAVLIARLLALAAPFRERPLRNPDLHFVLPPSMSSHTLIGWSAFPSDTATLFFGVAATLFLVSRRAGVLAFCHTVLVVGVARVYLGIHYPTDILAGAVLGVGAVLLIRVPRLEAAVTRAPMRWLRDRPQASQAALCLLVFLVGTTFEPVYQLAQFAVGTAKPEIIVLETSGYEGIALVLAGLMLATGIWAVVVHRLRRARREPMLWPQRRHRPHV
jgi:undecaprenyl-diphosphatase